MLQNTYLRLKDIITRDAEHLERRWGFPHKEVIAALDILQKAIGGRYEAFLLHDEGNTADLSIWLHDEKDMSIVNEMLDGLNFNDGWTDLDEKTMIWYPRPKSGSVQI
jgi:hypothetical protein